MEVLSSSGYAITSTPLILAMLLAGIYWKPQVIFAACQKACHKFRWKRFEILETIIPLVCPWRGILFLLNFASDLEDNSHAKFLASWAKTG